MFEIWQPNIVPARISHAASIPGVDVVDRTSKVRPEEILHPDATIVRTFCCLPCLQLCLCSALIVICLCDENREADIIQLDVRPRDVPRETLPADPRLETSGVDGVDHRDAVEVDV